MANVKRKNGWGAIQDTALALLAILRQQVITLKPAKKEECDE